jgi:hypothetical protein
MPDKSNQKLFKQLDHLRSQHNLGHRFIGLIETTNDGSAKIGQLERVASDFELSKEMTRRYWRVAQSFSKAEFEKLIADCEKNETPLSFSALFLLLRVTPNQERKKLLKRVIAENWSVKKLESHIVATRDKGDVKPKRHRGRKSNLLQRDRLPGELAQAIGRWQRVLDEIQPVGDQQNIGEDDLGRDGVKNMKAMVRLMKKLEKNVSKNTPKIK